MGRARRSFSEVGNINSEVPEDNRPSSQGSREEMKIHESGFNFSSVTGAKS